MLKFVVASIVINVIAFIGMKVAIIISEANSKKDIVDYDYH